MKYDMYHEYQVLSIYGGQEWVFFFLSNSKQGTCTEVMTQFSVQIFPVVDHYPFSSMKEKRKVINQHSSLPLVSFL